MSLSTGTRNLKFMQRAAARNALTSPAASPAPSAGTPQAAAQAGVASGSASPTRGSNPFGVLSGVQDDGLSTLSASTSRSVPTVDSDGAPLSKEEKEAMWVLPARPARSARPAGHQAQAGPSSGRRFVFEQSYMPFMTTADSADSPEEDVVIKQEQAIAAEAGMSTKSRPAQSSSTPSTHTSTSAGGGRMAFGNFGQEKKDAEMAAGDAYGSDDEERGDRRSGGRAGYMQAQGARGKKRSSDTQRNGYEDDREESRLAKIRKMAQDRHRQQAPQPSPNAPAGGFMRPGNYDPTLSTRPAQADTKPKISTSDKLRNIASSRPKHSSPAAATSRDVKPIIGDILPRYKATSAAQSPAPSQGSSGTNTAVSKKGKKRQSLNPNDEASHTGPDAKRVKVEPASQAAAAAASSVGASSIDDRERQLKAQKKKEKKARRKERESLDG